MAERATRNLNSNLPHGRDLKTFGNHIFWLEALSQVKRLIFFKYERYTRFLENYNKKKKKKKQKYNNNDLIKDRYL